MRTRSVVSRRAALLVASMLFLVRTASADDIRVMTSGAFTAAYLELLPQLERSHQGQSRDRRDVHGGWIRLHPQPPRAW